MISSADRSSLRDLARCVADIAALPIQAERREYWKQHNSLKTTRPMILVFPEGAWEELLADKDLVCESDEARRIEWQLRSRIYYHEHFQDNTVMLPIRVPAVTVILTSCPRRALIQTMCARAICGPVRKSRRWRGYHPGCTRSSFCNTRGNYWTPLG